MRNRLINLLTTALAATALSACGDQSGNQAGEDINQASATANDSQPAGNTLMDSHLRMQCAMAAAVGANASETWVRKMIEHHRGAIEMSEILVAQGGDPNVVEKARMTRRRVPCGMMTSSMKPRSAATKGLAKRAS